MPDGRAWVAWEQGGRNWAKGHSHWFNTMRSRTYPFSAQTPSLIRRAIVSLAQRPGRPAGSDHWARAAQRRAFRWPLPGPEALPAVLSEGFRAARSAGDDHQPPSCSPVPGVSSTIKWQCPSRGSSATRRRTSGCTLARYHADLVADDRAGVNRVAPVAGRGQLLGAEGAERTGNRGRNIGTWRR